MAINAANREKLSVLIANERVVDIENIYHTYGIYRITNMVDGMTYIGKTGVSFGDRWDCHKAQLRGHYHDNKPLQNAWDKYGEDNFEFVVIEPLESKDTLNEKERQCIASYRELGLCYNIADGGDTGSCLGKHLSDETKRKIGEKNRVNMTGRKLSQETRAKMSESQRKRFENMSDDDKVDWYKKTAGKARGYKWSQDSRDRFSKAQSIKPNGAKYDVDTIRKIRSMHEMDGMTITEISDALNIHRHTVYLIVTRRRWKNVE